MKIKIFGKILYLDTTCKGIKFFLEECCDFPTEAWFCVQYSCMNDQKCSENEMRKLSIKELYEILQYGIIDDLEYVASASERSFDDEIQSVRDTFKQYING